MIPFYPREYVESPFTIDYQALYDEGYRGIILDIDNTLVPHGDDSTPEVDEFFREIQAIGFKTVILSNNDVPRIERFLRNIDCPYVCDAAKPAPGGYLKALEVLGLPKRQVVCIGDQVFTDVLGANLCGIDTILVKYIGYYEPGYKGKRRNLEAKILDRYEHSRVKRDAWRARVDEVRAADGNKGSISGVDGAARPVSPAAAAAFTVIGAAAMTGEFALRQADAGIRAAGEFGGNTVRMLRGEINFCDISPATYAISEKKEILKRNLQDARSDEVFSDVQAANRLPNVVSSHHSTIVKTGPGIDPVLQENKAVNIELASSTMNGLIIHPGETFSFWKRVGNTTSRKGYKDGRIIVGGELAPGMGGGLCNLGNTIHLLALHSPMDVTELHTHSDALAPDHGPHKPFATGTSVSYNNIDFRFKNNTDQDVQLCLWCEDGQLYGELRSEQEYPWTYELVEEEHRFQKEGDKYFRVSKIYRLVKDRTTGEVLRKELILDNHSEVMYDYSLIPAELIAE